MKITKAQVLIDPYGPDYVFLDTDLPNPFPAMGYTQPLKITFQCTADTGADYVRANFGLEPEVTFRAGTYPSWEVEKLKAKYPNFKG